MKRQLPSRGARAAAGISAVAGWAGLALQLVLIVDSLGPALGIWRFVGFFTILVNLAVALVATAIALGSEDALAGPRARLTAMTAIGAVGITYSIALRSLWNPQGLNKVADFALHDLTPLLFLVAWLLGPHDGLRWSDLRWALVPPLGYAAYALARGAFDGWYAYWFLDPGKQSVAEISISMVAMLAGFSILGLLLIVIDRQLAQRTDS